ncbi:MAG: HDIG domain-containing metalloprotein [Armatimonadota bacterium]|nr:HDIG domain-containing protein [bacterium]
MDLQRPALALATVVVLSFLLSIHLLPNRVSLRLGDIAPETIYSHRTVRYEDSAETAARIKQATESIGKVYDPVPGAIGQAVKSVRSVFRAADIIKNSGDESIAKVRQRLGESMGTRISDDALKSLLEMDSKSAKDVEDTSARLVRLAMERELRDDTQAMHKAREDVSQTAKRMLGNTNKARVAGEIAAMSLTPNRIYNMDRTLTSQKQAQLNVVPANKVITRGEPVIEKGEPVSQEHLDKFDALGLRHPKLDYVSVLSYTLLMTLMVWIVVAYLWRYHNDVYSNTKAMWLLALIVMFSTLALRLGGSTLGLNLSQTQAGYLGILWVVAAGMFMAVLINPQVSVVVVAMLSIVLSLLLNNELKYATSALVTALVGIYSVANIRDRSDIMRAGGAISATGIMLVWITGGIANEPLQILIEGTLWAGVVVPMVATSLFFFGTAPLERPFGRTTHMSLLELADTNKPLLRRLVMEAPGTYAHSMTVGHLAEAAAEKIEADPLVARVASYYHDIGKIRRPHFFIENQSVENVHDRMNPTLSALVITSHIKDGVDTALEFKIPKVVLDIISQHHGTSLVQYFYNQYSGEQEPSTAVEQQFRYPGPKPQTKEAAVVMLADAVEAASRGLAKPTPAKIELLVNQIIADKLRDGQLDECELTFKNLSTISGCFVRALTSIMHARIDYAEAAAAEDRKLVADADSDPELAAYTGEPGQDAEPGSTIAAG